MENSSKNIQKSKHLDLVSTITKMKLVFSNAKLPNVLSELQKVGYTEERLNGFIQKLTELEGLCQLQKKEYAEQYAETERLNQKRTAIDEQYRKHLAFCKILFKGETAAIASLGLNGSKKNAYGAWYQQVANFYAQILVNEEFKTKVGTINIKEEDLNAQKEALDELTKIKEKQAKKSGEAQKATEIRDEAFDALYPNYTELISYAKILFQGDQTLEQLGIVVKRG